MDVFALTLRLKEEGAATVKAATDKLGRSFTDTAKTADKLDGATNNLRLSLAKLAGALAIGVTIRKFVDATSTADFAQAQLAASIRSTGGVAQQSIQQLNAHASALQLVSTVGDETINKAQALLLTFTNLRGDVFPKATAAVVDMAQALGQDLNGAALQVGKALNDPILGVSALGRAGVQFSESQKAMIRSLVETGRTADAQRIILAELETQFGGSALMARNTLGGALQALSNAFGDLFEITSAGTGSVTRLVNRLAFLVGELNNNRNALLLLGGGITVAVTALTALAFRAEIAAARIAILTAGSTIAGFVSLARAIGLTAAAMQVLGATGPMRIAAIVVALGAAGAAAFGVKKAIDGSAEAFAEFERKIAEFANTAAGGANSATAAITEMTGAVVDQIAALMQLVTLMPVTRVEAGLLAREERTLQQQLAAGNLTYAERLAILQRLLAVQKARESMQVRLTREELMASEMDASRMIGMTGSGRAMPQIRGRGAGVPSTADSLKALEGDAKRVQERLSASIDATKTLLADQLDEMRVAVMIFADSIANTLVDSLATGIETAVATGSLGKGFKALTSTLLSGLGSAMIAFGRTAIMASALMQRFMEAMASLNPFAALAAGIGMVALGGVLKGAAQRSFAVGTGTSSMGGGIGALATGGSSITRTFAPTMAGTTGANVQMATPMNVTIIGPNDAGAQRAIATLMDNASRRGLVQGAGMRTF